MAKPNKHEQLLEALILALGEETWAAAMATASLHKRNKEEKRMAKDKQNKKGEPTSKNVAEAVLALQGALAAEYKGDCAFSIVGKGHYIAASNFVEGVIEVQARDTTDGGLKAVLMELGNRLVTERGFTPGPQPFETFFDPEGGGDDNGQVDVQVYNPEQRRTSIITLFTEFLNIHKDAQVILRELGFAWPVVQRPTDGHE